MTSQYFRTARYSCTQGLTSLLLIICGLFVSAASHAQFLSAPQVLRESQFEYKNLIPASSTATFLAQANAEGASRFSFVGDNAFGDPFNSMVVSIYVRASSQSSTYVYQSMPLTNSAATFISQLNVQAALGYRYFGDQSYAGVAASVLVKESNNAAYHYKSQPPADTATAFLALINNEGALGYQYQGNIGFDSGGGNFVFISLFSRNTANPTTYTYETAPTSANAAALVTQANAQGARQFLYLGGIAFGTTVFETFSLYEKDNARGDIFRYEQLPRSATPADFLIQTNAQGARRFRYFGEVGFDASPFASLYASVAPIFVNGFDN